MCLRSVACVAAFRLACLVLRAGTSVDVTALPVLPTEKDRLVSLDGTWGFALFPNETNTTVLAEGTIDVPSNWEMRGFGTPRYDEEISGEVGVYRRNFTVPATWTAGDRIYLRFDGVMFGASVMLNGRAVGDFTSSFNAHVLDVTGAVRHGLPNELIVRTHGHPKGAEFDCHDDWTLHGIHRSVTLFAKPAAHIVDWRLQTKVRGTDADVRIIVRTSCGAEAKVRLLDAEGRTVGVGRSFTVKDAQLWTAETPDLYTLELAVPGETIRKRVGLREVTWTRSALLLNGRPIRLRGINHHDLSPVNGRAIAADEQRRDVELMKAANVNFIRTSHYPPSEVLLDACDELGVYVMDEVPFGLGDRFLENVSYGPVLLERARLTLERDINRTCVIVWSVGNENPVTDITRAAGRSVKEADTTRPWCFPMQPHYFSRWWKERGPTDGGDLLNCHYPRVFAKFEDLKPVWLDVLDRPFLSGEYAHAYGLDSGLLEMYDDVMSSASNYVGGAVWMFQDQGILRKASEVDPKWRDAVVQPDADHVYDSHGAQGTDGVVYSDRTPQTDYYELRKVYAPVRIGDPRCPLRVSPGRVNRWTLPVENRFDFTDLSAVKWRWRIISDGKTLAAGEAKLSPMPPHSTGVMTVEAAVPDLGAYRVCWLELAFAHPRTGAQVYERTFPLKVDFVGVPSVHYDFSFDEATGRVRFVSGSRPLIDSSVYFRADRRRMLAKEATVGRSTWRPQFLTPKSWRILARGEKFLDVEFAYAPTNPVPAEAGEIRMHVAFTFLPDHLRLTYSVTGDKTRRVTENGLAFELPPELRRFDWAGQGPYEAYPGAAMLSEFGLWSLDRDDLYFPGNRQGVRLVCASAGNGAGLAVVPDGADANVVFERSVAGVFLSHNCLCAGKGGKFTEPIARYTVEAGVPTGGGLSVFALGNRTEGDIRNAFAETCTAFSPFFRGYDD